MKMRISLYQRKTADTFFKDTPEAIDNSRAIADRCTVSFELGKWTFPAVPVSPGFKNHDEELRAKAYAGIAARTLKETKEVTDRIEYELGHYHRQRIRGVLPHRRRLARVRPQSRHPHHHARLGGRKSRRIFDGYYQCRPVVL